MRKKAVKVKAQIIPLLRELKSREKLEAGWISVNILILVLYRPWQIDPRHEQYMGKVWSYRESEAKAVFRALRQLEREGKIERRRVKAKDKFPGEKRWGGIQHWTEVREREELREGESIEEKP